MSDKNETAESVKTTSENENENVEQVKTGETFGIIVGGGAAAGLAVGTKKGRQVLKVATMPVTVPAAYLGKAIAESTFGKKTSALASKISNSIANLTVVKGISNFSKANPKLMGAAAGGALVGLNLGFAGMGVANVATQKNISELRKTTNIIGEVGGGIANLGIDIATTPSALKAAKAGWSAAKAAITGARIATQAATTAAATASASAATAAATASATAATGAATGAITGAATSTATKVATTATTMAAKTGLVASGALMGPLMLLQVAFMLLDILWNPFKNYYNSDLLDIRESMDSQIKKIFNDDMGMYYPLEIKPNFLSGLDKNDPNFKQNIKEFFDLQKLYYDNNGLITTEQALEEEQAFLDILSLRKMRRMYTITPEGDIQLQDPLTSTLSITNYANINMLELLPLALQAKRLQESLKARAQNRLKNVKDFFSANFPIFISSFLLIIFLSFFIITTYIIVQNDQIKF